MAALAPALEPLWSRWSDAGFQITPAQWLRIEQLLRALTEGSTPPVRDRLRGQLCTIVAHDPRSQRRFNGLFNHCFPPETKLITPRRSSKRRRAQSLSAALGEDSPLQEPAPVEPEPEPPQIQQAIPPTVTGPYHWALRVPETTAPFLELTLRVRRADAAVERRRGALFHGAASVVATLRAGGAPTLVHDISTGRCGIVAVVDRSGRSDHRTDHRLALLRRLDRLGAEVHIWELLGDGSVCRPLVRREKGFLTPDANRTLPTARALPAADRAEAMLLYGGDLARLYQYGALTPAALALASGWRRAAALVPQAEQDGGRWAPFDPIEASWSALEAYLAPGGARRSGGAYRCLDPDALVAPGVWSAARVEAVLNDLRWALPEEAFRWLCACSTLPELRWDLTMDLGRVAGVAATEENLLPLLDLPWFQGAGQQALEPIPPALRDALASRLPEAVHTAVHERARSVLAASAAPPGSWAEVPQRVARAVQEQALGDETAAVESVRWVIARVGADLLWRHPSLREHVLVTPELPYPALRAYLANLVEVPGGTFSMGSDTYPDEQPIHRVALSAFRLGKTAATVAMWKEYAAATRREMLQVSSRGWLDDHPMVNVSWEDAQSFCAWASEVAGVDLRLPSEAQWEYAARGPESREFPWGDRWDLDRCVNRTNSNHRTVPVGSRPGDVSWCGALDLAGNVLEWCQDWYKSGYHATKGPDPEGPDKGEDRIIRGGSWGVGNAVGFRGAYRYKMRPSTHRGDLGFRMVAPPPQ